MIKLHPSLQEHVYIYVCSSCTGNNLTSLTKGSYKAFIVKDNKETLIQGTIEKSTKNRTELIAIIEALKEIKESSVVSIVTELDYTADGITNNLEFWNNNNWLNHSKNFLANKDLWQEIYKYSLMHTLKARWIIAYYNKDDKVFKYNNRLRLL